MAGSPEWKCYGPDGEYLACTKHPEDAAMLMAAWGDGSTVKCGHRILVWREGSEEIHAGTSYDKASEIMRHRRAEYVHAAYVKAYGRLPT